MGYTPDILLEKVGGDLELALELLQAYLEDAPLRMESMALAVEAGNADEASRVAHSIKGMSGVVRAEDVAALALNMETAGRNAEIERLREYHSKLVPMMEQVLGDIQAFIASRGPA